MHLHRFRRNTQLLGDGFAGKALKNQPRRLDFTSRPTWDWAPVDSWELVFNAMLEAKTNAEQAGNGVKIAYSLPKEGAPVWFDTLVPRPHSRLERGEERSIGLNL